MQAKRRCDRRFRAGGRAALALTFAFALVACAKQPTAVSPSSANTPNPVADATAPPVYHVGDSLTFAENGEEHPRFVTAVHGDEVSWIDNANKKWTTLRDPTIPPLSEIPPGGGAEIKRSFDPANPTVFPLASGKQVSYKVTITDGDAPPREERDSCEVRQPDTIIVEAGAFSAWAIACQRGEESETLYYAPEIGAIVLSSRAKAATTTRLALVDYQKAGEPRPQQGAAAKAQEEGSEAAAAAAPGTKEAATSESSTPPAPPPAPVAEQPLPPAAGANAPTPATPGEAPSASEAAAAVPPSAPATAQAGATAPAAPRAEAAQPAATPSAAREATPVPVAGTPAAPTPVPPQAATPEAAAASPAPPPPPAGKPATATTASPSAPPRPVPKPRPPSPQLAAVPPAAATAKESGGYLVQYVSFNSQQDALKDWAALRARLPKLLGALKPRVDAVTTVGGTRLARFSLGPFESEAQAKQLCAELHAAGPDCWVRPLK